LSGSRRQREDGWLESASAEEFRVKFFGPSKQQREQAELDAVRRGQAFVVKVSFPFLVELIVAILFFGLCVYAAVEMRKWVMLALVLPFLGIFLSLGWLVLRPGPMLRMDVRGIHSALYGPIP
jgi:hypothetical protein